MNESICITQNYNLVASHAADKLLCINAIMTSIVASNSQPLWLAQVCDGQAACPNVSTQGLICCRTHAYFFSSKLIFCKHIRLAPLTDLPTARACSGKLSTSGRARLIAGYCFSSCAWVHVCVAGVSTPLVPGCFCVAGAALRAHGRTFAWQVRHFDSHNLFSLNSTHKNTHKNSTHLISTN